MEQYLLCRWFYVTSLAPCVKHSKLEKKLTPKHNFKLEYFSILNLIFFSVTFSITGCGLSNALPFPRKESTLFGRILRLEDHPIPGFSICYGHELHDTEQASVSRSIRLQYATMLYYFHMYPIHYYFFCWLSTLRLNIDTQQHQTLFILFRFIRNTKFLGISTL